MIDKVHEQVMAQYGEQLRVRVCGICVQDDKILMINHKGVVENAAFWCPPGGGLQYGENVIEGIQREFLEETFTEVSIEHFMFVSEFIETPLHAIELFFKVNLEKGKVEKGFDPELKEQIIQEVKWLSFEEIKAKPAREVHRVFSFCNSLEELLNTKGMI
ncbi:MULTISPECIES: NUDIX hydrolase [unclassified Arcicella]|uniref:NUDIX hydrolase n=1 Tax=unclassified Arcicella TaxID=2644986 RepID=UPI00285746FD|nr:MULTISPECIES: NUDIX hydrolase [unclassified Arcicella]MDR6562798.1 ADP-ribose pyrophosphatase YjhB (NUDIX family) [Arcicella sp. BE51]MDR6812858.1 ADP-ribose pyrophosphatase YjhB (NUDIX family) [Arcicella sp. BE140]MDR6824172.1 ADP-ribose pyrophosphatase YjhB (NUDIX family) [Arcicella sp. BE139]